MKAMKEEVWIYEQAVTDLMKIEWSLDSTISSFGWCASGQGRRWKSATKENEELKKAVDNLKSSEQQLGREMDEARKKATRYHEEHKKWNETLKKSNEEVQKSLRKIQEEYQATIDKIQWEWEKTKEQKASTYYRSLLEQQAQLQEAIRNDPYQIYKGQWYTESEDEKKLKIIEQQIAQFKEGLYLSQELTAIEEKRFTVWEVERAYLDFLNDWKTTEDEISMKLMTESQEMMKRTQEMENQKKIIAFFDNNNMRWLQLESHVKALKNMYDDEASHNLIDKLLKEKQNLIKITDERIQAESFVHDTAMRLATDYHNAETAMIQARKAEYDELIVKINNAIAAARALASSGGWRRWFAMGGYTGDGWVFEPAGTVHKGEYVIPQFVMRKLPNIAPGLLPTLESMRTGSTYTTNKSVNINGPINVRDNIDFDRLLKKAKWQL